MPPQLGDPVVATEYEYRDGSWDPKERTFGAFGGGTEKALGDGRAHRGQRCLRDPDDHSPSGCRMSSAT